MVSLEELLMLLVKKGGSDLHITVGIPPRIRVDGQLVNTENEVMTPDDTQKMIYGILNANQIAKFEKELELDMSFGIEGVGRFRTNVFRQRGAVGAVLRLIPYQIKTFEQLGLARKICEDLCNTLKGLVLVTGATGSGKSTTLASMIDFINSTYKGHILTVEDPVEFIHKHKSCIVNHREVGSDTQDFSKALRRALRQDPDVVLIGEMRDLETTEAALTISETGHLVFGTLHTSDCAQTINRIIDIFPSHQQQQVRTQLSFTLQAVFSQQLLPRAEGKGRVLAVEIMIATPAVRSLIRDNKVHQIYSVIQTGGKLGMKTMNQALSELYKERKITYDTAMTYTSDPDDLKRIMEKGQ
ncbi:MAG: type IV pilus twitching motility protein PilT [Planctomycetota bacterium]|nr:type IV pilus twitching motility protein PilT [Planctomycetota bacterium]MDI6787013.1 type IV pilus twitching motility protein PilT [Planctomycetota bacterium]